ncbi:MAG: hypothetical protein HOP07_01630 [Bacteriovoracaceae bacterium]|nr:hypothetical protein [Bacteriovoracaceae bacterium]
MKTKPIKQTLFKLLFNNESGIALILVLGVITILTFVLADFTFETKLNKIKIFNQQDKIQARLNAESGLNFAIAKLRLYQEGRNKIEKDENLKTAFPSSDLEAIIIQPFIFPIPMSPKANIIQKTALEEFTKKTLFRGELSVTFTKLSGFLNPNGLRILPAKKAVSPDVDAAAEPPPAVDDNDDDQGDPDAKKKTEKADVVIERKLVETLSRLLKDKSDTDEDFHSKYSNVDPTYLVKELKYYVNDSAAFKDSSRPEIEAKFSQKNISPKHAPMSSIDELYLLPSWDDAIIDLIKDRLSVHEVSVIAINEITIEDLKILFPNINNIQIEEFFKYRDGDEDKKIKGKKFKNAEDFKSAIVGSLAITTDAEYNDRMTELKQAGLTIDTSGKLYKVISRGVYNNAIFNLIAFIDLPIKPVPPKKKTPPPAGDPGQPADPGPDPKKEDKPEPTELLLPRVIEMRLE